MRAPAFAVRLRHRPETRALFNVHSLNEAILNPIGVVNDRVDENFALEIACDLMDFNDEAAGFIPRNGQRLHMRINDRPLASPICTHRVAPMDVSALHSVGPCNVRMHSRQDFIDKALIEVAIGSGQQFALVQCRFSCGVIRDDRAT